MVKGGYSSVMFNSCGFLLQSYSSVLNVIKYCDLLQMEHGAKVCSIISSGINTEIHHSSWRVNSFMISVSFRVDQTTGEREMLTSTSPPSGCGIPQKTGARNVYRGTSYLAISRICKLRRTTRTPLLTTSGLPHLRKWHHHSTDNGPWNSRKTRKDIHYSSLIFSNLQLSRPRQHSPLSASDTLIGWPLEQEVKW